MKLHRICSALILIACLQVPSANGQETFRGCGMAGRTKLVRIQALNRQKNRYTAPVDQQIDHSVSLKEMLQLGNDVNRFRTNQGATIIGYVVGAKPGGIESCNCKAEEVKWRDTHIDVVMNPQEAPDKTRHVVVEVTPRWRAIKAKPSQPGGRAVDWSTPALAKAIVGKWVKITGWMFFDGEHTNAAENTHANGKHNWRATAWEIHPVSDIQLTGDPSANPLNQVFRRDLIDSPPKTNQRIKAR